MLHNDVVVQNPNFQKNHSVAVISNKYRIWYKLLRKQSTSKNILLIVIIGIIIFITSILVILFGKKSQSNLCTKFGCILSAAKLIESINDSVNPCDDFYEYACGKWSHSHFLPLHEENSWFIERKQRIHHLITNFLEGDNSSDIEPVMQMRELYDMCMDTDHLNELGLNPLYDILESLKLPRGFPRNETVANFNLGKTLSSAQRILNLDMLIQLSTHFNHTNNATILSISPASTDLLLIHRKRHKVESESDEFAEQMLAFQLAYMIGVISEFDVGLATENDILTDAMKIILIESQLKMDKEETNETVETYMTLDELQEYMFSNVTTEMKNFTELGFSWQDYVNILTENLDINLSVESVVRVINPLYFQLLGNRLTEFKMLLFQRFIWWKVVDLLAIHTTNVMRTHKYILEERIYPGTAKSTRSPICIETIKSYYNEALIHKMATLYDVLDATKEINSMIANLKGIFEDIITNSIRMDDDTKSRNMEKFKSIETLIAFPEIILNSSWIIDHYKKVEIIPHEFIKSLSNIKTKESNEILRQINLFPNDSQIEYSRWFIDPMDVNAYYSQSINSIAIPFGILQYPFYVSSISALNYGAIGSILGHEFTHAMDDAGYSNKEDMTVGKYGNFSKCFIAQYNNFVDKDNFKVDGGATLAENIADYGGIRAAFLAYEKHQKNEQEPLLPGLENYTQKQLLFLSFANMWCLKETKLGMEFRIRDEHSPNRFRVLGSLANVPEFSSVWNCPLNSRMNPEKKCEFW